jgi:hypothetical protein
MPQMIRKEIHITQDLDATIRILSEKQNRAEEDVILDLIKRGMGKKQQLSTGEALLGLAKLGEDLHISGPTDLSDRHDDYLYGNEK